MSPERQALQEDARYRILQLLETNPRLSQRDLARETGISVGRVHYVLNALIEKGWVKAGNLRAASNKSRYAYVLTPRGVAEKAKLTHCFLRRKIAEFEALKAEIDELQRRLNETNQASR